MRICSNKRVNVKDRPLIVFRKDQRPMIDMELHRAGSEVGDIMDGKYDWRIEKLENHNWLMR